MTDIKNRLAQQLRQEIEHKGEKLLESVVAWHHKEVDDDFLHQEVQTLIDRVKAYGDMNVEP